MAASLLIECRGSTEEDLKVGGGFAAGGNVIPSMAGPAASGL